MFVNIYSGKRTIRNKPIKGQIHINTEETSDQEEMDNQQPAETVPLSNQLSPRSTERDVDLDLVNRTFFSQLKEEDTKFVNKIG